MRKTYQLSLTTQGPLYPPSEVMDEDGNFIVIGALNRRLPGGTVETKWGRAIVSPRSELPAFGDRAAYDIVEEIGEDPGHLGEKVLHTLPLPLPCSNYPMLFAPDQYPSANVEQRPSYGFHETPIPDAVLDHGRQLSGPVRLRDWIKAQGELTMELSEDGSSADFSFHFRDLLPRSLYTIMTLRENDLNPEAPTRPGPLGIPNVFVTDDNGVATFKARLPDPFPPAGSPGANRVINVVVLWMSYQMSHGGAIGRYGLGGDVHAQLKLQQPSFQEFETQGL